MFHLLCARAQRWSRSLGIFWALSLVCLLSLLRMLSSSSSSMRAVLRLRTVDCLLVVLDNISMSSSLCLLGMNSSGSSFTLGSWAPSWYFWGKILPSAYVSLKCLGSSHISCDSWWIWAFPPESSCPELSTLPLSAFRVASLLIPIKFSLLASTAFRLTSWGSSKILG